MTHTKHAGRPIEENVMTHNSLGHVSSEQLTDLRRTVVEEIDAGAIPTEQIRIAQRMLDELDKELRSRSV